MTDTTPCPLCGATSAPFEGFFLCPQCDLICRHPSTFISRNEEYARYLTHDNDMESAGYRAFLRRLHDPLQEKLPPGARGLDYGAGPGPLLGKLFEESGHPMVLYDPFFHPARPEGPFDFLASSETVEHFHHPALEFRRFQELVKPGGWVGIMTEVLEDWSAFRDWHYHRDPTHVVFYSPAH